MEYKIKLKLTYSAKQTEGKAQGKAQIQRTSVCTLRNLRKITKLDATLHIQKTSEALCVLPVSVSQHVHGSCWLRPCVCCLSLWITMCIDHAALDCLVSLVFFLPSVSYTLSTYSSAGFSVRWGEGFDADILLNLRVPKISHSLLIDWL